MQCLPSIASSIHPKPKGDTYWYNLLVTIPSHLNKHFFMDINREIVNHLITLVYLVPTYNITSFKQSTNRAHVISTY